MAIPVPRNQATAAPHARAIFDLTGRRAVVTGAARGIGRAAARALVRHGAEVLLVDILADELGETKRELSNAGASAECLVADLRQASDIRRIVEVVADDGADILVNNAGIMRRAAATKVTLEDLDALWEINVRGLFALTQALLPQLIERGPGGKIINLGSLGSIVGLERRTAYALTKGAVRQYTQSLAIEMGRHGICVNGIAPGYIDTDMTAEWLHGDPERRRRLLERIVLGRFGRPEDLEGAFVFLASPASDYVTGQILVIDGGWTTW